MLTPYQLPLFVRYFDGIDLAVSRRLLRPVAPSETTLTQEFCALMDAGTQRREASLPFDAEALQAALAGPGDMVDVQISIETTSIARASRPMFRSPISDGSLSIRTPSFPNSTGRRLI